MSFGNPPGVTALREDGHVHVQYTQVDKDGSRRNVVQCFTDDYCRFAVLPWWEQFAEYCERHGMAMTEGDLESLRLFAEALFGGEPRSSLDWYLAY